MRGVKRGSRGSRDRRSPHILIKLLGNMSLIIRPARPADHDALVEQFLGLNVHENPISHDRRADVAGAEASLEAAWKQVRETGGHALVAELDGRVVGHLFIVFWQREVFVREALRPYAYVLELFVREEVRDAGVGTALMAEAERVATARGLGTLALGVLAGNHSAEAFYARRGFSPYAIELVKRLGSSQ